MFLVVNIGPGLVENYVLTYAIEVTVCLKTADDRKQLQKWPQATGDDCKQV